jgi:hypothetical protein
VFSVLLPRWRAITLLDSDPPRVNSSFILRGFQSLRVSVAG